MTRCDGWLGDKVRKADIVCTCADEGEWIYWKKDEDGAARQEGDLRGGSWMWEDMEKVSVTEEDARDRVGWRPLWQLLKGQKTEIKPETCYMEKWLWRIPQHVRSEGRAAETLQKNTEEMWLTK